MSRLQKYVKWVKLSVSNLTCGFILKSTSAFKQITYPQGMSLRSRDLFTIWEITNNISETVQDRDKVVVEV